MASRQLTAFAAVFTVADVAESLAFFTDRLGFGVEFKMGDPVEYAILDRDAVSIHLMPAERAPASRGQSNIYVFVVDVDVVHSDLVRRSCPIEEAPADYSYGMREMSVRDPDGNRITFGQEIKRAD